MPFGFDAPTARNAFEYATEQLFVLDFQFRVARRAAD
jgi:hypothetical protein